MRLNLVTSFGGYADIYESRQWSFGRGVCSGGSRGGKFLGSRVVKYNEKSTRGAILPAFFAAKNFILRSGDFVCLIRAELLVMECF